MKTCRYCGKSYPESDFGVAKTTDEKTNGAYNVKDVESSVFNKVVLDNIVKKNEWRKR